MLLINNNVILAMFRVFVVYIVFSNIGEFIDLFKGRRMSIESSIFLVMISAFCSFWYYNNLEINNSYKNKIAQYFDCGLFYFASPMFCVIGILQSVDKSIKYVEIPYALGALSLFLGSLILIGFAIHHIIKTSKK